MKYLLLTLGLIGSVLGTAPALNKKFLKPEAAAVAALGRNLGIQTAAAKTVPKKTTKTTKPKTAKKTKTTTKAKAPVAKNKSTKKTAVKKAGTAPKPTATAAKKSAAVKKTPAKKKAATAVKKTTKIAKPKTKAPKKTAIKPAPSQSFSLSLPDGGLDFVNGTQDPVLDQGTDTSQPGQAICS